VTDAVEPEPAREPAPPEEPRPPKPPKPPKVKAPRPGPLEVLPLVLAAAAAVLLLGGVLFALATASADTTGTADRFRLLGQAANPFIAFLALSAAVLVLEGRRRDAPLTASAAALGVATAVSLAVVLLALNGLLTDFTGDTTALFRMSAVVSRAATLVLGGTALWVSVATGPARP
jgi:hypothetical protein